MDCLTLTTYPVRAEGDIDGTIDLQEPGQSSTDTPTKCV